MKVLGLIKDGEKLEIAGIVGNSTVKMIEALKIYEQILNLDPEKSKVHSRVLEQYKALNERLERIKKQGFWEVDVKTNPIDDSKTVSLILFADSGKNKRSNKVAFIARCKSNSTEVYIDWDSYLGRDANVLTRIGKERAATSNWGVSTDKKATFNKQPVTFLKKMEQSNKLIAQITPYNGNPITAVFDTTGLKNALLPLKETCGW